MTLLSSAEDSVILRYAKAWLALDHFYYSMHTDVYEVHGRQVLNKIIRGYVADCYTEALRRRLLDA